MKLKKDDGTEEIVDIEGSNLTVIEAAAVKNLQVEEIDFALLKELED